MSLEQRLEAVEREVADLKKRLAEARAPAPVQASGSWIDKVAGIIDKEDEEAFLQMMEYGRQYRQSDRPAEEADDES